jgi:A/G-specific adenine glycosylase
VTELEDWNDGIMKKKAPSISDLVLRWYGKHQRDLPWRRTKDPYRIWISEVMLQQTQVDTVLPYYRRFLSAFPSVKSLAEASLQDVLKIWENLGYYSRARHLHLAAKQITACWGGQIPDTEKALLSLAGIGRYTAAAILSFAFGQQVATVDGNVRRVICRLFAIQDPLDQADTLRRIDRIAEELVPKAHSSPFNQGLMDLGATVCSPRKPSCNACPLHSFCLAKKQGLQDTLPMRKKRSPLAHKDVTAGIVADRQGRLLVVQRPHSGLLGGLWKFPGGERKPKEALQSALRRSVKEEVGVRIQVKKPIASVKHAYTHFRVTFHAFQCELNGGKPRALGCHRWQWTTLSGLSKIPFSRGERKIIALL